MTIVVDSNIVIKWFIEEEHCAAARALLISERSIAAPEHLLLEVASIAWRYARRGVVGRAEVDEINTEAERYLDAMVPTRAILARAVEIAWTINHAVYDCLFAATAEVINAPLATADRKFARKLRAHGIARTVRSLIGAP